MSLKEILLTLFFLAAIGVTACNRAVRVPAETSLEFDSGHCAGCLPETGEEVFSFIVRGGADFDKLTASCFTERIREEWLPPRPEAGEQLIYVAMEGTGCEGCLGIVNIRESSQNIVVDVEGGFQGNCDKLIAPGAWALIPLTDKPVSIEFKEVICSDNL
jgi:hypothetical protein